ncbi:MAG TPA: lysophospholipid acyltransferase family protein [Bryobacteraceae bacterium]|nr:lysophospholipid acyltransferase family protein [Bryobacteraceae bacterium]
MKTIEYWAARILLTKLRWLPPHMANWRVALYARVLDLAVPRLRRIALRNLELAGFEDRDAILRGVFRSLGRVVVTFAQFPRITRDNVHRWIRYEGLENFTSAQARGRGVLVATGHLGNWELSAYTHALMTGPMNIVVRPLDNPRVDALVEQRRTLSGNPVIRKKEAAREILRALRAGQAVGILIDQNSSLEEGVFVDFFGVKACANAAFVKFAHHTGAAVVPGFALWSEAEQRYILRFYPEIPMGGDVLDDTQRVHTVLEQVIREHPDQWLWIHRRWKTRPPGEPPIY